MEGTRKFKAWLITLIAMCLMFGVSLFVGVSFAAENVQLIILIIATFSGTFFGANFGEHWAKTRK